MKKIKSFLLVLALINLTFISCEQKEDEGQPPVLPPAESMAIDFSIEAGNKSASQMDLNNLVVSNYDHAKANVGVFTFLLGLTVRVPVAAFAYSFAHKAISLGDNKWQWSYSYDVFGGTYKARLTGEVISDGVLWEMHIMKEGIGGFEELKWYEGTSNLDGSGGEWLLYHSVEYYEPFLKIVWEKTGDDVGDIKYTYVRELKNDRSDDAGYGSFIEAGKVDGDLDAFYTIHLAEFDHDVFIEWSTTEYNGRVKDQKWLRYNDDEWHCWDYLGADTTCE